MSRRCAFLSMDDLTGYVCDDHLAATSLRERGWALSTLSWRQRDVDWSEFDAVVIRSPWDYQNNLDDFLQVLAEIESSSAALANPLPVVKWNIEKTYLKELADKGVPVVPTIWGKAGAGFPNSEMFDQLNTDELVLKRVVGAGGFDAFRLRRDATDDEWREVEKVYADKDWMAQPFLSSVLNEGEYSLFYFNGRLSHAIGKVPKQGEYRVQEEHGGLIMAINPSVELRVTAEQVLAAVGETLLYARVDLIRGSGGEWLLMEIELVEPALYFRMDADAAGNFAEALDDWFSDS